ncbi:hypothetical protein GGI07_001412 [Coemansia sp. Benny D115]|nr:hypothetical protein GGI07_001412 [Coemansia sp. Benny D115]
MSYVDYAKQLSQYTWTALEFVHSHTFPLCGDVLLRSSEQWAPLKTVQQAVGATPLTYLMEAVLVYICAQVFIFFVRLFSNTLYRLLKFVFWVVAIALGVSAGLYFFFTSTLSGQEIAKNTTSGSAGFWLEQVMSLATRLGPMWDGVREMQKGQQQPPQFLFQDGVYPPLMGQ